MYGSYAGFLAYHTERGRDVADYDEVQVNPALLVASEWLDNAYRDELPGLKTGGAAQVAEWPRTGVVDIYGYAVSSATVPDAIERATYEVALRVLKDREVLSPDVAPNKYKRVSIDGALSVDYADTSGGLQTQMPIVGQILSSLLWQHTRTSVVSGRVYRV